MDKLTLYRQCVQTVLTNHSRYQSQMEDVESELIFDEERDRYQLMRVGWNGLKRVYHSLMHFDIKAEQVWIQQNMTDVDVAEELVEMGVFEGGYCSRVTSCL